MTETIKLQTKYFGEIEYADKDVVRFPDGLFGFEEERGFLLLPFDGSGGGMLCLQSVQTPALAFVVLDPFTLKPDYAPELERGELKAFGVKEAGELGFYVLCAVKNPVSESTVNLKCPLVVHPETREARQIIMERYEMRHPHVGFPWCRLRAGGSAWPSPRRRKYPSFAASCWMPNWRTRIPPLRKRPPRNCWGCWAECLFPKSMRKETRNHDE